MLLIKVEPLRTMLTPASSTTAAMTSTYSSALAVLRTERSEPRSRAARQFNTASDAILWSDGVVARGPHDCEPELDDQGAAVD
jgi:hypothetical protein